MPFSREDYIIIMRTFWPVSPVVGESMLCVAENLSKKSNCRVITQNQANLYEDLQASNRGNLVKFSAVYAFSNSSSNIIVRLIDLIWFSAAVSVLLVWHRPRVIYVATDPPLLVPIIVAICSKLFGARYVYHVQDIHPEASRIVFTVLRIKLLRWIYISLRWLDAIVVRNAAAIITLTSEMGMTLAERYSDNFLPITYISNPSAKIPTEYISVKYDFSFVGNAGRLQLLPMIITALRLYLSEGGAGKFAFAGGGVMSKELEKLSNDYPKNVIYFGKVPVAAATEITLGSSWAMLPIDDKVCRYAFPSKAATYAMAKRNILAICGKNTSVGYWVSRNQLGIVIPPDVNSITAFLKKFDKTRNDVQITVAQPKEFYESISNEHFVKNVTEIVIQVRDSINQVKRQD